MKWRCYTVLPFILSFFYLDALQQKQFVIVVASYNNANWYKKNLDSIFCQTYSDYRVIYIDDASSDGTADLVEEYIQENTVQDKIILIKNQQRKKALANLYEAFWSCKPDEIIVCLDGDDWFKDKYVLSYVNTIYDDSTVWLTYGQYERFPGGRKGHCKKVPTNIIENNAYREYPWVASHLRTFYAGLFHQIKQEDLKVDGEFFPMAWDLAFMFPMLEMAGVHAKFISKIVYVYNRANVLNDDKIDRQLQVALEQEIRNKKQYQRLYNGDFF